MRSRPTSAAFSEYACPFAAFDLAASSTSGTASPLSSASHAEEEAEGAAQTQTLTQDEFMDRVVLATEQWARAQARELEGEALRSAGSDARSVALSAATAGSRCTVVPVRIVRRADAEEKADEEAKVGTAGEEARRRRTWPSYKALRQSVSNIVRRREAPRSLAAAPAAGTAPAERVKSSAASLFTRRRRVTVQAERTGTSARAAALSRPRQLLQRALSTSAPPAHRAAMRRSRSFSGFTDVVGDEELEELDEATAEARGVVEDIGRRWAFEEVLEATEGFLFEE